MSQYMNFFVRAPRSGEYVSIADYGRSSKLYETLERSVPYGSITSFDEAVFEHAFNRLTADKALLEDIIVSIDNTIKNIWSAVGNSVSEKLEAVADYEEAKNGTKEDLEEIKTAIAVLQFLDDIAMWEHNVFVGIEVGDPNESEGNDS